MNEPAFPLCAHVNHYAEGQTTIHEGMTLRDYFAAQALTGMQIWDAVLNKDHAQFAGGNGGIELLADTAFKVADAMLEARGNA